MFRTKGRLEDALLVIGVLAFCFGLYGAFTESAEAGADEVIHITTHYEYYDNLGTYCSDMKVSVVH